MKIIRTSIFLAATVLLNGCAFSYYHKGDTRLVRFTIGTDQILGPFEMGTDGTLKLGGATTGQSESAGKIAGAVVEAAKPKLLP